MLKNRQYQTNLYRKMISLFATTINPRSDVGRKKLHKSVVSIYLALLKIVIGQRIRILELNSTQPANSRCKNQITKNS